MSHDAKEQLFPAIGTIADRADQLPENEASANSDEDRPMQEIESLCMKCGEQVRFVPISPKLQLHFILGISRESRACSSPQFHIFEK